MKLVSELDPGHERRELSVAVEHTAGCRLVNGQPRQHNVTERVQARKGRIVEGQDRATVLERSRLEATLQ